MNTHFFPDDPVEIDRTIGFLIMVSLQVGGAGSLFFRSKLFFANTILFVLALIVVQLIWWICSPRIRQYRKKFSPVPKSKFFTQILFIIFLLGFYYRMTYSFGELTFCFSRSYICRRATIHESGPWYRTPGRNSSRVMKYVLW